MANADPTRRRAQGGFTLLEIMIALGILVTICMIVWGTIDQLSRMDKKSARTEELYRGVRLATARMVRDLSQAYVSQNESTLTIDKRTLFVIDESGGSDEVRFTTMNHMRLYEDANESDQTTIRYYITEDGEDRDKKNLMRFEARRPDAKAIDQLKGDDEILMRDVAKLDLEVFDPKEKEWKQEWNTTSADGQPFRLPERVRITLTIMDERGEELKIITETQVYMQEALNLQASG